MKAIILSAGRGTRLSKYVKDCPKGMLKFDNTTIIKRQIDIFRECGIDKIIVVRGYMAETINYDDVKYYNNQFFATTNMVESLFCAEQEFSDDLIISYADIMYEKKLLMDLMEDKNDISVTVDLDWKKYWKIRYGTTNNDIESLKLNQDGFIVELGNDNVSVEDIDARYVGLLKFSKEALLRCTDFYHRNKLLYGEKPWKGGRVFEQAYMTDFMQALIDSGERVNACKTNGGWIEFDTNEDYELLTMMAQKNTLKQLINLEK